MHFKYVLQVSVIFRRTLVHVKISLPCGTLNRLVVSVVASCMEDAKVTETDLVHETSAKAAVFMTADNLRSLWNHPMSLCNRLIQHHNLQYIHHFSQQNQKVGRGNFTPVEQHDISFSMRKTSENRKRCSV